MCYFVQYYELFFYTYACIFNIPMVLLFPPHRQPNTATSTSKKRKEEEDEIQRRSKLLLSPQKK